MFYGCLNIVLYSLKFISNVSFLCYDKLKLLILGLILGYKIDICILKIN